MVSIQEKNLPYNAQSYMALAFTEAANGLGKVSPNPCVGAVIVFEGRIIGSGFHTAYGKPHAEIEALASVSEVDRQNLQLATMYVTLEPCFHHGKTPPCVQRILIEKIKHVVIAHIDPNIAVAGKSVALMRSEGVLVEILSESFTDVFAYHSEKPLLPSYQPNSKPFIHYFKMGANPRCFYRTTQ